MTALRVCLAFSLLATSPLAVLPGVSIDDFVFGVAAVDAEGHESLVSAYVNPSRPDAPVQTLP